MRFEDTPFGKVYLAEDVDDTIDILDLLNENYPSFLEEFKKADYELRYSDCRFFNEILFEGKFVGFAAVSSDEMDIKLTDFFVLPEFRGNGLFKTFIKTALLEFPNLCIYKPSRRIVEALIDLEYAKQVNENIVYTAIDFALNYDDLNSNIFVPVPDELDYKSTVYDIERCSTLITVDFTTPNMNITYYTEPLKEDLEFNPKGTDEEYFRNLKIFFKENLVSNVNALKEVKANLPKMNINFSDLMGDGDVGGALQNFIDEGEITYEEASKIREELMEDYNEGKVSNEGLVLNMNFRISSKDNDFSDILEMFAMMESKNNTFCPFCHFPVNPADSICNTCGYNLDYDKNGVLDAIDERDDLYEEFLDSKDTKTSIKYSFKDMVDNYDLENSLSLTSNCFTNFSDNPVNDILIENIALKSNITPQVFRQYLVNESIITKRLMDEDLDKQLNEFNIKQLQGILDAFGLDIKGNKKKLISRIKKLDSFDIDGEIFLAHGIEKVFDYDGDGDIDRIRKLMYLDYLERFFYCEYIEYMNDPENIAEDMFKFLDDAYKICIERKDYFGILNTLKAKGKIYLELIEDNEKAMENYVEAFIRSLNLIFLDELYYQYLILEEYSIIEKIEDISIELDDDKSIEIFDKISEKFDTWLAPKEKIKDIFLNIIDLENYEELIDELGKDYYYKID